MHSNHRIILSSIKNKSCHKKYRLDTEKLATLNTQCFFDDDGKLTDITWSPLMIVKRGMPFFHDLELAVESSIKQDQLATDILKLGKVSEYKSIQNMHELAEKHCLGIEA